VSYTSFRRTGSYQGPADLTLKGSEQTQPVFCDFVEYWKYLQDPHGTEIPFSQEIRGTIFPVPEHGETGPHVLTLENGRVLKCFIRGQRGEVICEDESRGPQTVQ
jgi:hypothetical protein